MGFLTLQVDARDLVGDKGPVARVLKYLPSIMEAGGNTAARVIRNHIRHLAQTRHDTADRLGAQPTNHFKASDVSPAHVSDSQVYISISTPGMSRAFQDIDILPVEARSLAIPMHADAYGFQPRELTDRGERLFRILRRGERRGGNMMDILFRRGDRGQLEAMYSLVGAVHQKQDRTLLPSDDQLNEAFEKGASKAVEVALALS